MNSSRNYNRRGKRLLMPPLGVVALCVCLVYTIASLVIVFNLKNLHGSLERLPFIWFIISFPVLLMVGLIYLAIKQRNPQPSESYYDEDDFEDRMERPSKRNQYQEIKKRAKENSFEENYRNSRKKYKEEVVDVEDDDEEELYENHYRQEIYEQPSPVKKVFSAAPVSKNQPRPIIKKEAPKPQPEKETVSSFVATLRKINSSQNPKSEFFFKPTKNESIFAKEEEPEQIPVIEKIQSIPKVEEKITPPIIETQPEPIAPIIKEIKGEVITPSAKKDVEINNVQETLPPQQKLKEAEPVIEPIVEPILPESKEEIKEDIQIADEIISINKEVALEEATDIIQPQETIAAPIINEGQSAENVREEIEEEEDEIHELPRTSEVESTFNDANGIDFTDIPENISFSNLDEKLENTVDDYDIHQLIEVYTNSGKWASQEIGFKYNIPFKTNITIATQIGKFELDAYFSNKEATYIAEIKYWQSNKGNARLKFAVNEILNRHKKLKIAFRNTNTLRIFLGLVFDNFEGIDKEGLIEYVKGIDNEVTLEFFDYQELKKKYEYLVQNQTALAN